MNKIILFTLVSVSACFFFAFDKMQLNTADASLEAATELLASLDADQKKKATFTFEEIERKNWHFTVKVRPGLAWEVMSSDQREMGIKLLNSALSQHGYEKVRQIMDLENVLRLVENRPPNDRRRHPELYQFSFFGTPDKVKPWGWRFEGHHISLNFTMANGQSEFRPLFMGSNPAKVPYGPKKGLRVLDREEDVARKLLKSLTEAQLGKTVYSEIAPGELVHEVAHHISPDSHEGINITELNESQQQIVKDLITVYTDRLKPELAKKVWDDVNAEWSSIHFAWAGGTAPDDKHYYRLHGEDLWIEYDKVQNDANHIHTIFRSIHNDFGQKTLADHYAEHKH